MQDVTFVCNELSVQVIALSGQERLGEASAFELELVSAEPIEPSSLLGQPCAVLLPGPQSGRVVHGVVIEIAAVATEQARASRQYRVSMRSVVHLLSLRRQTRVFQHQSVPDIIKAVLEAGGVTSDAVATPLLAEHAEREYVTQYAETDATFLRRMCEEEGLYFRLEARDGFDAFVLEDSSPSAPKALTEPLELIDETALKASARSAFRCQAARQRCAGKVTLRDYDPSNPAVQLEGVAEAGKGVEKATEVYRAPGRFTDNPTGKAQAQRVLESLRAEAQIYRFHSTAMELAPGLAVELQDATGEAGTAVPEGELLVTAVRHDWHKDRSRNAFEVTAIPLETPFRLPMTTPRPRISGLHTAIVTGGSGEEIHTDEDGCVKVRFPWDRYGPGDDKSSLPVRVSQPNTPGSMLFPRVGWEVLCAFEDGDPDRPYVLGRTYNAKWLPPFGLPANKTITAIGTVSSPGGGAQNSVHIDDAAGRQHMFWNAGFAKTTTVANNMLTQTVGFEQTSISGSQTRIVGGNESESVKSAKMVAVGSQSATVGAVQNLLIKASGSTKVGSESVAVGGALLEQVGDPVAGAKGFAKAAALAGVGMIPVVGPYASKGAGAVIAVAEAYGKGGWDAARTTAYQQATGIAADFVPAGDALVAAADGAGLTPWSDKAKARQSAQAAGGGTGGAGAAAGAAAQAAPGHRKTIVDGVVVEAIGGAYSVNTPGSIKWTGVGATSFAIGGSHSTRAVKVSFLAAGASSETLATRKVTAAKTIGVTVKGAQSTTIGGSLTSKAGGPHNIEAGGNLTMDVAGSVVADGGAVVFMVGGSIVAVHPGGILLKASKVTINGKSKQSGKATSK